MGSVKRDEMRNANLSTVWCLSTSGEKSDHCDARRRNEFFPTRLPNGRINVDDSSSHNSIKLAIEISDTQHFHTWGELIKGMSRFSLRPVRIDSEQNKKRTSVSDSSVQVSSLLAALNTSKLHGLEIAHSC
ncbi:hypothetical protein TNCV_3640501 [Trichonephila clavipes]|nr:hypothetical protein TNCV_3640501 [Trichonephila clavipes]